MGEQQNLGHALRTLRKSPGFSFLVILILALGIGANTAIFTLINAALLKPLPYRDPSALVFVAATDRSAADTTGCLSYPHFELIRDRNRVFAALAGFTNETFNFTSGSEAVQLEAARVSSNFFDVLGTKAALGRSFVSAENTAGGAFVAMIGDRFWRQRFHSDPKIVGQSIALDGRPYTVVGVLPASFQFALLGTGIDVWTTHLNELNLMMPQQLQAGACYLSAVARLAPGISISQAQAEMRVLDNDYLHEYPKLADADPNRPVEIEPLKAKLVGGFQSVFLILSTAVGFVLLIACANAAGLLLTRALKRRREVAIRVAMGAGRRHLMAQLLAESILLAMIGGVAGVAISFAATRVLLRLALTSFPRANELSAGIDWHVLAFALVVSIASGVVFGLVPALQFSKTNVSASLREEGRGTAGSRSHNFSRNILVAGQIALSSVLLIGAALLVRSFVLLERQAPGFEPHRVLTMNMVLPPARYSKPDQMVDFYDDVVSRVETLPGVKAAAVSSALPLNVSRITPILVEGQPAVPLAQRPIIIVQTFTPSYLRVMQIPVIAGRFFNEYDKRDSMRVAVVNQAFARKFFSEQNAIGKHIWTGRMTVPTEIVGVLGDIKNVSLSTEPEPEFDLPFSHLPWARMNLIIPTTDDPKTLVGAVRRQIAAVDRDQPVTDVETMDELLSEASSQPRTIMILLTAFAAFAFVLAIVGLYGVISYSVAQRTQEMGVRVALGATRGELLALVLRQGAQLAGFGIAAGVGSALMLTRLMQKLVYGIATTDPVTFVVVPIVFLAFALLASYIPALRATRVDVMDALRA